MKKHIIILILFILILSSERVIAENSYYDWSYKKPILVSSCSADYPQIKISMKTKELYNAGKIRSDCGDIRFGDSSNVSRFSYWIYECNINGSSVFWINVDKTESPCTIYMYYGSSSVTTTSDPAETFVFFDNFSTNTENAYWTKLDGSATGEPYIDTISGYLRIPYTSSDMFVTKGFYNRSYRFISKSKGHFPTDSRESMFGQIMWSTNPNIVSGIGYAVVSGQLYPNKFNLYKDNRTDNWPTNQLNSTGFIPSVNTWYIIEFGLNETYMNSNVYDSTYTSKQAELSYYDNEIGGERPVEPNDAFILPNEPNHYSDTDWFAIAKYNGVEPDYWLEDEQPIESPPQPTQSPSPTLHSLIISNTSWQNILSAVPANNTLIVSDSITPSIARFINEMGPDYIYTIGFDAGLPNSYTIALEDVPGLFFPDATKALYISSKDKAVYASALARITGVPLVFNKTANFSYVTNLETFSNNKIRSMFLEEVRKKQGAVNYIILTNENNDSYIFTGKLAADKGALIVPVNLSDPIYPNFVNIDNWEWWNWMNNISGARQEMKTAITYLKKDMLYDKELNYFKGNYIMLMGIPHTIKKDFVDNGFLWNDTEDRNWYLSDLDYGDTDMDGEIELAVGRYPEDIEGASLLYAEQNTRVDGKTALVAAEYLHKYWPVTLLYVGGGMWNGKNIETILLNQSYGVIRLVEHRSDLIGLAGALTPEGTAKFAETVGKIAKVVSKQLGKTTASAVSHALYMIKGAELIEEGLETYLEYDWTSNETKVIEMKDVIEAVKDNPPGNWSEFVWELFSAIFLNELPELTTDNLLSYMPQSDVIYYNGVGNGTHWILPNGYDEMNPWSSPYDGTNYLEKSDVPQVNSLIVWDNSNLGARGFGQELMNKGSLSYIGSSAVVYTPYSDELDLRFFNEENTVGQSLMKAVNEFEEDWFVWDPVNFVKGDTIKAKMLRSYILLGDPALQKDPVIEEKYEPETEVFCSLGICMMKVEFSPPYSISKMNGSSNIVYEGAETLLEAYKPMLPLYKFGYQLPDGSRILMMKEVKDKEKTVKNVFTPLLIPVSHGFAEVPEIETNYTKFPEKFYRLEKEDDLKIILSPIQMVHNDTAVIHQNVTFFAIYKTPAEMWVDGKNGTVKVKIRNMKKHALGGRLVVEVTDGKNLFIGSENITSSVHKSGRCHKLFGGDEEFEFDFNLPSGYYRTRAFLFADDFVLGPRYDYFRIN